MLTSSLLALVLASTPLAVPGVQEQERFKGHFTKGEELYGAGEQGAAIWHFRQAETIRPTAEVAFDLGKCHQNLGDIPFATYYFRLYLRRAPNASDALQIAAQVGAALAGAEAEGRGLLEVEGSALGLTIDGKDYPELPAAVLLPQGDYELLARYPSGVHRRMVQLRAGRTTTVGLEPLPPPLVEASSSLAAFSPGPGPAGSPRPSVGRAASYVLLGASAVALGVGSTLGAMAAGEKGRLSSEKGQLTAGQARELAVSAGGKGSAANLLWLAGGVGALGGGVLLVFSLPEPGGKGGGGR